MKIRKSSRHAKITGDFGEAIILYWLSKHGYECARVDHTGIDIIARHPRRREVMGVSVKSRSRLPGTERESLSIPKQEFVKTKRACRVFRCVPYFGLVVDGGPVVRGYLVPMGRIRRLAPVGKRVVSWRMTERSLRLYDSDPGVTKFGLSSHGEW